MICNYNQIHNPFQCGLAGLKTFDKCSNLISTLFDGFVHFHLLTRNSACLLLYLAPIFYAPIRLSQPRPRFSDEEMVQRSLVLENLRLGRAIKSLSQTLHGTGIFTYIGVVDPGSIKTSPMECLGIVSVPESPVTHFTPMVVVDYDFQAG